METILLAITTISLLIMYSLAKKKVRKFDNKIYRLENQLSKYTNINNCPHCNSNNVVMYFSAFRPKIKCIHCNFELTENNVYNSYLRLIRTWNYMSIKRHKK
jgi:transcription elongation factor Elf1